METLVGHGIQPGELELGLEEATEMAYRRYFAIRYEWVYDGPFYAQVPAPLPGHFDALGAQERISALRHFKTISEHLLSTYVISDHFGGDHESRRKFREALPIEVDNWLRDASKVRLNRLSSVVNNMELILMYFKEALPALHENLGKVFKTWQSSENAFKVYRLYERLDFREKTALAREIDDVAYRFLEVLSKPLEYASAPNGVRQRE